jgi:hypothetical protein
MAKAITPMRPRLAKAMRQPQCWPIQAPAGTPSRVARVRPENISAMAEAFFSAGTRPVATTAPTPKKVPWVSEVSTRAAISRHSWGDDGGQVAGDEDQHQPQQQALARPVAGQQVSTGAPTATPTA